MIDVTQLSEDQILTTSESFIQKRKADIGRIVKSLIHDQVLNPRTLSGEGIDLGCSLGVSTSVLRRYGGHITSVDYSPVRIEEGIRRRFLDPDNTYNMKAEEYLMTHQEKTADFVTFFGIPPGTGLHISHLFELIQPLLKPQGIFLLTTISERQTEIEDLLNTQQGLMFPSTSKSWWDSLGYLYTKS